MRKKNLFEVISNITLFALSLSCILPFVLLIASSLTDNSILELFGYSFWPRKFSLDAYTYLFKQRNTILRAYGITILNTITGTIVSLAITAMTAYPLSRQDYPLRKIQMFFVFFTILFNGGLVPTYLVYTQIFSIKNTIFGLIIPGLLLRGFYVLVMRTYFSSSIPSAIIESATIDGAGEFKIFFKIVLPLSIPILATIGLLVGVNYWNDWFNGFIYVTDPKLFSIQNLLNRILQDIQFLQANAAVSSEAGSVISQIPATTVRMAIAVIGSLPVLLIYPFFQKYFQKGITIGAVKG